MLNKKKKEKQLNSPHEKTISLFHCLWINGISIFHSESKCISKHTRTIAYMKYIYFHSAFIFFLLLSVVVAVVVVPTTHQKNKYFCLESSVFSYLCFNTVVWCCGVSHRNRVDYIQYSVFKEFEFNFLWLSVCSVCGDDYNHYMELNLSFAKERFFFMSITEIKDFQTELIAIKTYTKNNITCLYWKVLSLVFLVIATGFS